MNYELAKELKDAGFPQKLECNLDGNGDHLGECLYMPTLEELIEACGKNFESLYRNDRSRTGGWSAFYPTPRHVGIRVPDGQTPTEAVARLWLALNKK